MNNLFKELIDLLNKEFKKFDLDEVCTVKSVKNSQSLICR